MTTETTQEISSYCNRYGDKLVELMELCRAGNTQEVPEKEAKKYLAKLKRESLSGSLPLTQVKPHVR